MPKTTYAATSPYYDTAQTSWYLKPIQLREISADSTDTLITLGHQYQNRPDRLSYELYGTPAYWWVFMIRNMNVIRDPIWDFVAGIEIYVPTTDRLKTLLG